MTNKLNELVELECPAQQNNEDTAETLSESTVRRSVYVTACGLSLIETAEDVEQTF